MPLKVVGLSGILLALLFAAPLSAAPSEKTLGVDHAQVHAWNRFVDGLHDLHRNVITKHTVRTEERIGGYHRRPDFYREISFLDATSGRLLSRLRWERDRPTILHAIEHFVYDDAGRLKRDYGAYYLPGARNAPVQTLINFHHHESELHAFRQFDASGERLYEQCKGTWFGEHVSFEIEEPLVATPATLTASEAYVACFGFLPAEAGVHIDPSHAIPGRDAASGAGQDPESLARQRIARYTLGLQLAPDRAETYLKRGKAYFELFEFDRAVADLTRAIELDARLDEAYFWRGMAAGRASRFDDAIADLTVFIERNPRSSLAYTKRGVRRIWKGDYAGAEQDLVRAVALDPRNSEAHDDLGVLQARRQDYEAAVGSFRAAIHLDHSYEKAHHNLAFVLHLAGRSEEALISIDTALRLGRRTRSSALLKAEILDVLGRSGEAQALRREAELLPQKNWSENLAVK